MLQSGEAATIFRSALSTSPFWSMSRFREIPEDAVAEVPEKEMKILEDNGYGLTRTSRSNLAVYPAERGRLVTE